MLPRDVSKLRALSGCSKDSIVCYFYRRRKEVKERLAALPDLRDIDIELIDTFGNTYSTKSFTTYEYMFDKFSLHVKVIARDRQKRTLIFDVPKLQGFEWVVKDAHQDQRSASSSAQETPASSPPARDIPEPSPHNESEYFRATFRDS